MKFSTLVIVVVVLSVLIFVNVDGISQIAEIIGDQQLLRTIVSDSGIAAPFVIVAIHFVHVIIAMLPGQPIILAVGYILGPYFGFLINWLSIVAASQVAYLLSKKFGRSLVEKFVPEKLLSNWDESSNQYGFSFFLGVFFLPVLPGDSLNYLAGITTLRPLPFFIANLLGRAPQMFLLTYVGANSVEIIELGGSFPQGIIALALIAMSLLIGRRISNNFFPTEKNDQTEAGTTSS